MFHYKGKLHGTDTADTFSRSLVPGTVYDWNVRANGDADLKVAIHCFGPSRSRMVILEKTALPEGPTLSGDFTVPQVTDSNRNPMELTDFEFRFSRTLGSREVGYVFECQKRG
jgi:hypothetical protein